MNLWSDFCFPIGTSTSIQLLKIYKLNNMTLIFAVNGSSKKSKPDTLQGGYVENALIVVAELFIFAVTMKNPIMILPLSWWLNKERIKQWFLKHRCSSIRDCNSVGKKRSGFSRLCRDSLIWKIIVMKPSFQDYVFTANNIMHPAYRQASSIRGEARLRSWSSCA